VPIAAPSATPTSPISFRSTRWDAPRAASIPASNSPSSGCS
jgi:hypothetical protein